VTYISLENMKFSQATKLLALVCVADAFAPSQFAARPSTSRSLMVDPSALADVFSSISLSDADVFADTVQQAAPAADAVADAAAQGSGNGWFGFLTGPTEGLIQIIHSTLVAVGLDSNAWGISIIGMTLVIKLLTFPLTKTQLESTNKMQVSNWLINLLKACGLYVLEE
jgi:YidC/Oxa1 family membrane protein insertase